MPPKTPTMWEEALSRWVVYKHLLYILTGGICTYIYIYRAIVVEIHTFKYKSLYLCPCTYLLRESLHFGTHQILPPIIFYTWARCMGQGTSVVWNRKLRWLKIEWPSPMKSRILLFFFLVVDFSCFFFVGKWRHFRFPALNAIFCCPGCPAMLKGVGHRV